MFEANRLDEFFPSWQSIEIFGAPGSGKTYFCRQLMEKRSCLATSDDAAIRHFVDIRYSKTTKLVARLAGRRLMKNYYKFHMDRMSRKFWANKDANLRRYIDAVEQAIDHARLRLPSQKNVHKSIRNTGLAVALSNADQRQILIDEGLTRKLIGLMVQSKAGDEPSVLLDLLRTCLTTYPWQKNAIFLDAPASVCIQRQVARGHIIQRLDRPQAAQQAAAEQVRELCNEAGWQTLRLRNAAIHPDLPPTDAIPVRSQIDRDGPL